MKLSKNDAVRFLQELVDNIPAGESRDSYAAELAFIRSLPRAHDFDHELFKRQYDLTSFREEIAKERLDALNKTFYLAADDGDASKEFEALLAGYRNVFGDKADLLIHCLHEHCGASMCDYLWGHLKCTTS